MAKIDVFFKLMHEKNASDLHLSAGEQPALRIDGDIERIKYQKLSTDIIRKLLYEITPEEKIEIFEETGDVDFGYEIPGLARYRANYFMQKDGVSAVFRAIPNKIQSAEALGLPQVINKLATLPRGLVLVTGPTGSGKSTTLAAILDQANQLRKDHIITIEDPIEFVHISKNCIVNHREVSVHTKSFAAALRGSLREDPDIILVGELRDLETTSLALKAANTGYLVFSTLHTSSTVKTIDRIVEIFPAYERAQVRSSLSDSLRAVIGQILFKRLNQPGRCVALEVLIATPGIRNLIRESKSHQIPSMIQTGKMFGMQLMDDSIMNLYKRKWIGAEEAYEKCLQKKRFGPFLKTPPTDFTEI